MPGVLALDAARSLGAELALVDAALALEAPTVALGTLDRSHNLGPGAEGAGDARGVDAAPLRDAPCTGERDLCGVVRGAERSLSFGDGTLEASGRALS